MSASHRSVLKRVVAPLGVITLAAAMALFAGACEEKNVYVPPPPPKVTVATPVTRPVTEYLEFTGNIAAVQTVELRARVAGYLEQVLFKDGDLVKEGDLLFQIERAPYIAAVNAAKADLAQAQAALKQATLTAERRRQAGATGAISKQQVDEAEAIREGQAAEVLARKAALERTELDLGYTQVRAPFDGHIGRRLRDPGSLVGAGELTLLAEINQIQPVFAYFTINERTLLTLLERRGGQRDGVDGTERPRQPLFLGLVTDGQDFPYEGDFDFAAISLDAGTGTLQLRGVFENLDGRLLPGLFVRIRAPVGTNENAMLVPQRAVGFDQLGEYVMVVGADNTVERRGVELGSVDNDMQVISKGLKGDEQVIVDGLLRAIPGRPVAPVIEQADATAMAHREAPKAAAEAVVPAPEPAIPAHTR